MILLLILLISMGTFIIKIIRDVKKVVETLKELSEEVEKEGKKTLHVAGLVRDSVEKHPGISALVGSIILKIISHFFNSKTKKSKKK